MIDAGQIAALDKYLYHLNPSKLSTPSMRHVFAYKYEILGNLDSAEYYYNLNIREGNNDTLADRLGLGRVFFLSGEYERAFEQFWLVETDDSCYASVRYYLGLSASQFFKTDLALHLYRKQLLCYPNDHLTKRNMAAIYYELGDYYNTVEFLASVPDTVLSIEDAMLLANSLLQTDGAEWAVNYLDLYMQHNGGDERLLLLKVELLNMLPEKN